MGEEFLFLRVWRRGADRGSDPALPLAPNTPIDLGHTGLRVTFSGNPIRPGDYWIIAARPRTPKGVVPWELETGRSPQGTQVFKAPLAVIEWRRTGNVMTPEVIADCRPRFVPLTQQDTCATFT